MNAAAVRTLALSLFLSLFTSGISAQLPFQGGEILLNEQAAGDQLVPDVAMAEDGFFAAAWLTLGPFGTQDRISARIFDPDGRPAGGELDVDQGVLLDSRDPVVAALAGGGWVIAWAGRLGADDRIYFRVLDAGGTPLTAPRPAVDATGSRGVAKVAALSDGGFVVGWTEAEDLSFTGPRARTFDADGTPRSDAFDLGSMFGEGRTMTDLQALPDGTFVAVWTGDTLFDDRGVAAQRFAADGSPMGPDFAVNSTVNSQHNAARLTVLPDGDLLFVWRRFENSIVGAGRAWMRRFSPTGVPRGGEVALTVPDYPAVAADGLGNILVVHRFGLDVMAQLHRPTGEPVGEAVIINSFRDLEEGQAVVAANRRGQFVVAWSSGETPFPGIPPGGGVQPGPDGDGFAVMAQRLQHLCPVRDDVLCLQEGRFSMSVDWATRGTTAGPGTASALTGDTGTFWFFREDNVELMVKVLDGRAVNGHFWVFWGSMTNVQFDLEITDEVTGASRSYRNARGTLRSRRDIRAFSDPGTAAAPASTASKVLPPPEQLSFHGGRIAVSLDWRNHRTGETGQGVPLQLTEESGAFWFFRESNLEVVVKVLDGGPVNGFFWVLYGALTDLEYELRVSDAITGVTRIYTSAAGQQASGADVEAIAVFTPLSSATR